jgi:hypothetical protein
MADATFLGLPRRPDSFTSMVRPWYDHGESVTRRIRQWHRSGSN